LEQGYRAGVTAALNHDDVCVSEVKIVRDLKAVDLKSPERIAKMPAVLRVVMLIVPAGKRSFTNVVQLVRGIHDPSIALPAAEGADGEVTE